MTTTVEIDCPAGEWTEVSNGSAIVTVQARVGGYLVAVGAAPPSDLVTGLAPSSPDGIYGFSGLAVTDKVYLTSRNQQPLKAIVIAS